MAIDVERYYRAYGPMVLRRCQRLLRDEELAVDALQDTFVQLLRHRGSLDEAAPSRLLNRMATNVCLNHLRTRRRHPEDRDEALLLEIASLDEAEDHHMARNLLQRLFAKERASTRTMAVLHYLDGLTLEEVARQVGLSVSGVRKRLRPLKDRLSQMEGAPS